MDRINSRDDEKLLFCIINDKTQILCGLAHIGENLNVTLLTKPEIIFDSLSHETYIFCKSSCSAFLLNNDEVTMAVK